MSKEKSVSDIFEGAKEVGEKQTFVKVTGQKFAFKAINVIKQDGWIEFDRVNTKTGEIAGRLQFPMTSVESIEVR